MGIRHNDGNLGLLAVVRTAACQGWRAVRQLHLDALETEKPASQVQVVQGFRILHPADAIDIPHTGRRASGMLVNPRQVGTQLSWKWLEKGKVCRGINCWAL